MTERSENRKAKLLASRIEKKPTAGQKKRIDREKTSRCWFELKSVHRRSAANFSNIATLLAQYANPHVLAKIKTNGQGEQFNELIASMRVKAAPFSDSLASLWARHEHKAYLCRGHQDMMAAFQLFEDYIKFDTDVFSTFNPIIEEMNEIYNSALTQLREAAIEAGANVEGVDAPDAVSATMPDALEPPVADAEAVNLEEVQAEIERSRPELIPASAENQQAATGV